MACVHDVREARSPKRCAILRRGHADLIFYPDLPMPTRATIVAEARRWIGMR
jgi:hypothetical protein